MCKHEEIFVGDACTAPLWSSTTELQEHLLHANAASMKIFNGVRVKPQATAEQSTGIYNLLHTKNLMKITTQTDMTLLIVA